MMTSFLMKPVDVEKDKVHDVVDDRLGEDE
jgi:hypothetical protein